MNSFNSNWQRNYYPVPQTLSDSDSEKEVIHTFDLKREENSNINKNKDKFLRSECKSQKLSLSAKCLFIFSISLCILIPVTFICILPCPEAENCPLRVPNWEKKVPHVELFGKIYNIKSKSWHLRKLVVLFKQDLQKLEKHNGIIAFSSQNGEISWNVTIDSAYRLDCNLVDVTKDKVNDCLVQNNYGFYMINGATGSVVWKVAKNLFYNGNTFIIDFPVVSADLDNDNIDEILVVSNDDLNSIVTIISGKTGRLLIQSEIKSCQNGHVVNFEKSYFIYCCKKHDQTTEFFNVTISMLKNKLAMPENSLLQNKINSSQKLGTNLKKFNGHTLNFKNEGICPGDCRVSLSLTDKNSSKEIAAFIYANSYLFEPVVFSLKTTNKNLSLLKGHSGGFILKFWEWFDSSSLSGNDTKSTSSNNYYSSKYLNETLKVNFIKEVIMIITLNDTNLHVINASLIDIVQLCFVKGIQHICQPNVESQKDSLLIDDLDFDGSKELVSYYSTFVNDFIKEHYNWRLVSNIKVVRLESELPKLYQAQKL